MMSTIGKSRIIAKRRDRCLATILSFKEEALDDFLPEEVSDNFRKLVLDSVNDVCNLAIDLLEESTIVNEVFLERIEDIVAGGFDD